MLLTTFAAVAAGGGCARYEHDLVEPADVAQHIGTKAPVVVSMDPAVRYEARTAIGKLYDAFTLKKRDGQANELIEQIPDVPENRRQLKAAG